MRAVETEKSIRQIVRSAVEASHIKPWSKSDNIELLPIREREVYLEYHRDIVFKKAG